MTTKTKTKKRLTHEERVLKFLDKNSGINRVQAWNRLGVSRLSAVIYSLEAQGYDFDHTKVVTKNNFGEKMLVTRYSGPL